MLVLFVEIYSVYLEIQTDYPARFYPGKTFEVNTFLPAQLLYFIWFAPNFPLVLPA